MFLVRFILMTTNMIYLYISATPWNLVLFCLLVIRTADASMKKGVATSNGRHYHCGDEQALTHIHWW